MKLLELNNITKYYKVSHYDPLLTTAFMRFINRQKHYNFTALKDISFSVNSGESLGIIGENGSGKSTLLRILTGVTRPSSGIINTYGSIGSLLELGAGFHPYLTGKENIYLNASILGMRKSEINSLYSKIVEFADVGDFIDAPVSTYSDGMYLRLGFSVAVHLDAEILIVDEVLAVGDVAFQRKCISKINELLNYGKSLIIVSHDLNLIRSICNKVGWLQNGRLLSIDAPNKATGQYLLDVSRRQGTAIIDRYPLTVVFQKGKILIFWKGIEVTKNLCGYTSIFSQGVWHDSTDASWNIEINGTKISATAKMHKIPIVQNWIIDVDSHKISLQIAIKPLEYFQADHETINLMLSENYSGWRIAKESGMFPAEFSSDFWSRNISITKNKDDSNIILLPSNSNTDLLPKISFSLDDHYSDFVNAVSNTDYAYRARVIQFERMRKEEAYSPAKIYNFKGTILLE